jgi:hypothetical protein
VSPTKSSRRIESDNKIIKERLGLEDIKEMDELPI